MEAIVSVLFLLAIAQHGRVHCSSCWY